MSPPKKLASRQLHFLSKKEVNYPKARTWRLSMCPTNKSLARKGRQPGWNHVLMPSITLPQHHHLPLALVNGLERKLMDCQLFRRNLIKKSLITFSHIQIINKEKPR
jgi:hypothetical protein